MNLCVSLPNGAPRGGFKQQACKSCTCAKACITDPRDAQRPSTYSFVRSAILSKYEPRGVHSSHVSLDRSCSLRAASIAAATASQTVQTAVPDVPRLARQRPSPSLPDARREAQELLADLKAGDVRGDLDKRGSRVLRDLCLQGERWSEVLVAYQELGAAGVRVDSAAYQHLMSAALEAGACLDVVDLLSAREAALGPPALSAYCSLISRLLKLRGRGTPAKQAAHAVWRALRAAGLQLDAPAFRTGMNLMVELGRYREATQMLQAMRAAGHRPGYGAYHILIKYHARRGDMDAARKLFAQLRAYRGNDTLVISAYNTLLSGFVRLGDLTMARAVLDKARREGAAPDAFSYSSLAAGLAAAGRLAEAEALLAEMAGDGVPPSEVVYGAILDGCARLNDWAREERLLARMRSEGLRPNVAHFNMLIRGRTYAAGSGPSPPGNGAIPPGSREYTYAAGGGPSPPGNGVSTPPGSSGAGSVSAGSGASAPAGSSGGAPGGPSLAGGNGTRSGPTSRASSHSAAGAAMQQPPPQQQGRQRQQQAQRPAAPGPEGGAASRADSSGRSAASSSSGGAAAGSTGASIGDPAVTTSTGGGAGGGAGSFEVESLLAEMRASGLRPDAATYGTLVHAAVRAGSVGGALEVLSAMRLEGVAPDGAVFTSLMKLFRQQGMHAQALEFFSQLAASRSSAVDLWALSCLAALHASGGRLAEVAEAVRAADALAAEQGLPPPPEASYALLQGYGQQRQLRPLLLAFRRFLAAGGRPHRKMCEFVYRQCLAAFDFAAAAQVLRAMRLMRGLALREELYRQQWQEAQRRMQARRQTSAGSTGGNVSFSGRSSSSSSNWGSRDGGGSSHGSGASSSSNGGPTRPAQGPDTEKLKWWFGLPNKYYDSGWP